MGKKALSPIVARRDYEMIDYHYVTGDPFDRIRSAQTTSNPSSPSLLQTIKVLFMKTKRNLNHMLNHVARVLRCYLVDFIDFLFQRRDKYTPPLRKVFVGNSDFRETGKEFLSYFVKYGQIQTSDKVLDVGCGIGRMAVPLISYLEEGTYDGFDISKTGIQWCRNNITPSNPHFRFQLADIYNKEYNPNGRGKASEYRFPYQDNMFDFVFLTSVFTHMFPEDVQNYLQEIGRVLNRGKRCLITFFLLNKESCAQIDHKKSTLDFAFDHGFWRTIDRDVPEKAVAYEEDQIRALFEKSGLRITEPILYGSWCGREKPLSYQDIIIAVKD